MRSSSDISNVEFQKTMGGYKPSDVQQYLSEVAEDYGQLQRRIAELESANAAQAKEITALKEEQISVHNLLINAQKLADKTVEDAKAEALKIVNEAHAAVTQIMSEAEARVASAKQQANDIKKNSDMEMQKLLSKAVVKSENMITAAHDSVARQQLLFDKLKVEAAAFKKELIGIYKKQLDILKTMPDEVPFDAQRAADAMAFETDQAPDFKEMAVSRTPEPAAPAATAPAPAAQAENAPAPEPEAPAPVAPAVEPVKQQEMPIEPPAAPVMAAEPVEEPVQQPLPEEEIVAEPQQERMEFAEAEAIEPAEQAPVQPEAKAEKKKTSFFGKLNFSEDEDDEDFEPRDLFGRKK